MRVKKPTTENVISFILLFLAFFWGLNVCNLASFFLVLIFCAITSKVVLLRDFRLTIPKSFVLLGFYFTAYSVFASLYTYDILQIFITYFFLPIFAVFSGYTLVRLKQKGYWNRTEYFTLLISLGLATYGILNIYQRYQQGYNTLTWVAAGRMSVDFWRGNEVWPTLQATYFLPIIGLLFYMIFISNGIIKKLLFIVGFIFSLITAFDIGSRTLIVLSAGILLLYLLVYLKSHVVASKNKRNVIMVLVTLLVIFSIAFATNFAGIRTSIMESSFVLRLTGGTKYDDVEGLLNIHGRDLRYKAIFEQMFTHLFGNIDLGSIESGGLGSAHNTWLEIFRVAGVVPFVLFIGWTVHSLKVLIHFIRFNGLLNKEIAPPLVITIVITIQFMTESMFTLNTHLMNVYFMLAGMLEAYYIEKGEEWYENNCNCSYEIK